MRGCGRPCMHMHANLSAVLSRSSQPYCLRLSPVCREYSNDLNDAAVAGADSGCGVPWRSLSGSLLGSRPSRRESTAAARTRPDQLAGYNSPKLSHGARAAGDLASEFARPAGCALVSTACVYLLGDRVASLNKVKRQQDRDHAPDLSARCKLTTYVHRLPRRRTHAAAGFAVVYLSLVCAW